MAGPNLSTTRTISNTPAEHVADHNLAHQAINDVYTKFAVNVKDYGALGNGSADDRAAIQSALDAASTGGSVYFPPGTYRLATFTISGDRILKIYPDQTLIGAGRYASVLKVGSTFGDYKCVFGLATDGTYCGRLTISNLGVDQNAANGNALNIASMATYPRMVIRAVSYTAGSAATVTGCAFLNGDNVNTVYIAADTQEVSDNHFIGAGSPSTTLNHDHSTIYATTTIAGGTQKISNNLFRGTRLSGGARTAIETHGGTQTVVGNTISDYIKGVNLTGIWDVVTDGITCIGNTLSRVCFGIHVWSQYYGALTSGTACRNVVVSGNNISLDRDAWNSISGLSAYASGVLVDVGNTAPIEALQIQSNNITFLPISGTPPASDYHSAGIGVDVTDTAAQIRDLEIIGNTIVNPLSTGIFLNATIRRGKVHDNTTVDPGQSTEATVTTAYRSGIVLARTIEDVSFERNLLIDTRGTHYSEYGIIAATSLTSAVNCSTRANRIRYTDGATPRNGFTPVSGGAAGVAFTVHEVGDVRPNAGVRPGSTDLDSAGRLWTQTTASIGSNWVLQHHGTGSPESVVTAPIGSRYFRTDGGASTTLYIKESGTGNTGWRAV